MNHVIALAFVDGSVQLAVAGTVKVGAQFTTFTPVNEPSNLMRVVLTEDLGAVTPIDVVPVRTVTVQGAF